MPHGDKGNSPGWNSAPNAGDPDQQGDLMGQAPDGNEDGDDRGSPLPPPPVGAGIVPPQFVAFVNGLPPDFVQGFEAATVGGVPWTAIVLTDLAYTLPPVMQPTARVRGLHRAAALAADAVRRQRGGPDQRQHGAADGGRQRHALPVASPPAPAA